MKEIWKDIEGYEDLCELVALSNNSINRITELYLESIALDK